MGTEFTLKKVSPTLIQVFEEFGELGFDIFDKSDLLDEDEGCWTEDKIDEFFYSDEKMAFPALLRERILEILLEGQQIDRSDDLSESFNGRFIEGINFLLAGKRQFYQQDFVVKFISYPGNVGNSIVLVNSLVGRSKIKEKLGLYASYLKSVEVKEVTDFLPRILDDDFEMRWKALQELDDHSEYFSSHHVDPSSFSQIFDTHEVREFIQDELLPFLQKTKELGYGILSRRSY